MYLLQKAQNLKKMFEISSLRNKEGIETSLIDGLTEQWIHR